MVRRRRKNLPPTNWTRGRRPQAMHAISSSSPLQSPKTVESPQRTSSLRPQRHPSAPRHTGPFRSVRTNIGGGSQLRGPNLPSAPPLSRADRTTSTASPPRGPLGPAPTRKTHPIPATFPRESEPGSGHPRHDRKIRLQEPRRRGEAGKMLLVHVGGHRARRPQSSRGRGRLLRTRGGTETIARQQEHIGVTPEHLRPSSQYSRSHRGRILRKRQGRSCCPSYR
mmetsp:Transcript_16273/g.32373  ORF Transcript_16273/g.32373 Transcript_16273/m.32373 type:complete len:224 (+) Transcript_16273:541-1212(+)